MASRASRSAILIHFSSSSKLATAAIGFAALLRKYLCDCKVFFEDFNHALVGCVKNNGLFSDGIGLNTDHSVWLSPQLWLWQLYRGRFELLSDVWKYIIIIYGWLSHIFIAHSV